PRRWSDRRIRILSPASGRPLVLLAEASARFVAASTGPVVLVVSMPPPASLRACLGRCRILGLVLLMLTRRSPVLPCSGSSEVGEATCPPLRVVHLSSEENILVAVLGVQLEPLPVVRPC
ncbi:MAG: hypothetical protein ACK559_05540, partial [bacterium]